jgi:hypothetical protein
MPSMRDRSQPLFIAGSSMFGTGGSAMSNNRLSARASGAVFAAALLIALSPQAVWAGKTYNASHSNTANPADGSKPCASGESWDGTTKKCVAISAINYNASKSNTGNFAVQGSDTQTARHGLRSRTSAKYHCGHGEYMLSNGDCVPNPPNNPN